MMLPWFLYLALCIGVGYLARTYTRSGSIWFCLSLFFTPLVTLIFLVVAGIPSSTEEVEKQVSEEVQRDIQEDEKRDYFEAETKCARCGASLNILTGAGIAVPDENAPWDIRCQLCGNPVSAEQIEPKP